MTAEQSIKPVGRIRRSWEIVKSSWRVFKLDKELATLPLLSAVVSVALTALVALGLYATDNLHLDLSQKVGESGNVLQIAQNIPLAGQIALALGFASLATLVTSFFAGAIIYGATERFNGGDPTVKSSLAGAGRRLGPLALFSFLSATIGLVLQSLEERLPLAGKITAYLFDAAWSVATIFAVPVIVLSDKKVGPLDATKKSVGVIKKVWGENIVSGIGIGAIALFAYIAYTLVFAGLVAAGFALGGSATTGNGINAIFVAVPVVIGIIGYIVIGLVFSALSSIAKAALYHYATTGEAPNSFKSEILRSSMTHKKARKIFA